MGLQEVTEGYKGLQGVTGGYKGLQGVTRGDKGLQNYTNFVSNLNVPSYFFYVFFA